MRIWYRWDWHDVDAPLSWPDPQNRIVLCDPCEGAQMAAALFVAACDAMSHGAALVVPADDEPPAVRLREALAKEGAIPGVIVRRQDDFYGVRALNRIRSKHKALFIEPEEALDLDPPVCPDCGRLDVITANDGTPYCTECDGAEMCYSAILDPLNEGIDLVIVRGRERPIDPQWVRDIRDQCKAAGVAFCFLSWGSARPVDQGPILMGCERTRAHEQAYYICSTQKSGRMLDGREWLEVPEGL